MTYDSEAAFNHHDRFLPGNHPGTKRAAPATAPQATGPATPPVTSGPSAAVVEPPAPVSVPEEDSIQTVADTPATTPAPLPDVPDDSPASPSAPESQELLSAPADGSFPQPTPSGDTDSGN